MRTTPSILLLQGLALLAGKVAADLALDNNDVPAACRDICQPIVQLTSLCHLDDNGRDDNDAEERARDEAEKQCICTNKSFNVAQVGGLCQSCIEQNDNSINGKSSGDLSTPAKTPGGKIPANLANSEMRDILNACNLTSTSTVSYAPSATSVLTSVGTVVATPTSPAGNEGHGDQPGVGASTGASLGLATLFILGAGLLAFAM